jgi:hypothetical protein
MHNGVGLFGNPWFCFVFGVFGLNFPFLWFVETGNYT